LSLSPARPSLEHRQHNLFFAECGAGIDQIIYDYASFTTGTSNRMASSDFRINRSKSTIEAIGGESGKTSPCGLNGQNRTDIPPALSHLRKQGHVISHQITQPPWKARRFLRAKENPCLNDKERITTAPRPIAGISTYISIDTERIASPANKSVVFENHALIAYDDELENPTKIRRLSETHYHPTVYSTAPINDDEKGYYRENCCADRYIKPWWESTSRTKAHQVFSKPALGPHEGKLEQLHERSLKCDIAMRNDISRDNPGADRLAKADENLIKESIRELKTEADRVFSNYRKRDRHFDEAKAAQETRMSSTVYEEVNDAIASAIRGRSYSIPDLTVKLAEFSIVTDATEHQRLIEVGIESLTRIAEGREKLLAEYRSADGSHRDDGRRHARKRQR
jgi:hypothetical protein